MRHQQIQTRHYSYKTVHLGSKTYSSLYLLCLIKGFGTEGENRFVCFTLGKHIYRRGEMREQGDYSHMTTLFTLANAEEFDLTSGNLLWFNSILEPRLAQNCAGSSCILYLRQFHIHIPLVSRVASALISVWQLPILEIQGTSYFLI